MIYFVILLAIFIFGSIQIYETRTLQHKVDRSLKEIEKLHQKIDQNLKEIERLKKPVSRKEY